MTSQTPICPTWDFVFEALLTALAKLSNVFLMFTSQKYYSVSILTFWDIWYNWLLPILKLFLAFLVPLCFSLLSHQLFLLNLLHQILLLCFLLKPRICSWSFPFLTAEYIVISLPGFNPRWRTDDSPVCIFPAPSLLLYSSCFPTQFPKLECFSLHTSHIQLVFKKQYLFISLKFVLSFLLDLFLTGINSDLHLSRFPQVLFQ